MPFFSVIIPTRNRPGILLAAVKSVLAQDFEDYEIILVDDGSQPELDVAQLTIDPQHLARIRIVNLGYQLRGRGAGYARNAGVWASTGAYCAFLDDDDVWTKVDHLANAHRAITSSQAPVDTYYSNQVAVVPDTGETRLLWLYPLIGQLEKRGRTKTQGVFAVDVADLMSCRAFSHLNTTIVSRKLYDSVDGIDENLSYEEDLDFYLRCIDQAQNMLFCPDVVARHHIPDLKKTDNASTAVSPLHKLNIRLYLLNKNILVTNHCEIANFCRSYTVSTIKQMAEHYAQIGDYQFARYFAGRALGVKFSAKWFSYYLYLWVMTVFAKDKHFAN